MEAINLYIASSDHDVWESARLFSEKSGMPISHVVVAALRRYLDSASRPVYIYRLYGWDGALLYIGITLSTANRFAQHAKKDWWPNVDQSKTTLERRPDRATALQAESAAIRAERPKLNILFGKDQPGERPRQKTVRIDTTLWNQAQEKIDQIRSKPSGRRDAGRPRGYGTKVRNFRIQDDLWLAAQQKAVAHGMDMSMLVRWIMARFVDVDLAVATAFLMDREHWETTAGRTERWTVNLSAVIRYGLAEFISN